MAVGDRDINYQYIGRGSAAIVEFANLPDVRLDHYMNIGGGTNQGIYPALDRFGRQRHHMWIDGGYTGPGGQSAHANVPPIVKMDYQYDADSNRISAYDGRPGAKRPQKDFRYDYDGQNRLVNADRGSESGSAFTYADVNDTSYPVSQAWNLDMLGNWNKLISDLNADGADEGDASDNNELRTHNGINELLARDVDGSSTDDFTLDYDSAGNLKSASDGTMIIRYIYDAWNRLVRVQYQPNNPSAPVFIRLENQYNGLHQRVVKRSDSGVPDGTLDQQRLMTYSSGWQLLEERIHDDASPSDWEEVDRAILYVWGLRGIDDILLRRIDVLEDEEPVSSVRRYHLTDPQFSSVAIIDGDTADLISRGAPSAYGEWRHQYPHDLDGNGAATEKEIDQIFSIADGTDKQIGQANYNVDADINRDGNITYRVDYNRAVAMGAKPALVRGMLSDPADDDNIIGYAGYVFNAETMRYTVRFRHYDPVLGCWTTRDPVIPLKGNSLYAYVNNRPINRIDPLGLHEIEWEGEWTAKQKKLIEESFKRVRDRADDLLKQLDTLEKGLSACCKKKMKDELDGLRRRLKRIVDGHDSKDNLELRHNDFGSDNKNVNAETFPRGWYGLLYFDAQITFNDGTKIKWEDLTPEQLDELNMHELAHVAEFGEGDQDGTDTLYDPHVLDDFMARDLNVHANVKFLITKAKKSCNE